MLGLLCLAAATVPNPGEVPPDRVRALAKGINLSHWWSQNGDHSDAQLNGYITTRDFDLIANMGFTHVRFPINPVVMWNDGPGLPVNKDRLALLNQKVDGLLERGLAVILDAHPEDEFKEKVETDAGFRQKFEQWWVAIAQSVKDKPMVFIEPMNEPVMEHEAWMPIQEKIARAVRASAPQITLVLSGGKWSGRDDLLKMSPYANLDNVVYNFHCYDPFLFTHQGATWGWDMTRHFKDVPFPSSPEAVAPLLPQVANEEARGHLKTYGEDRWDEAKMREHLLPVRQWADRHNVPITVNEFGTYRAVSPVDSRERWLAVMTKVFGEYGFGWSMWDYAGGFAVVDGPKDARIPNEPTLRGLGLLD